MSIEQTTRTYAVRRGDQYFAVEYQVLRIRFADLVDCLKVIMTLGPEAQASAWEEHGESIGVQVEWPIGENPTEPPQDVKLPKLKTTTINVDEIEGNVQNQT